MNRVEHLVEIIEDDLLIQKNNHEKLDCDKGDRYAYSLR